ncbi:MAG: ABC transporter permease, partial [Lachnospiraceae bacterium]|nr:ABC transporter permease [Lachnospiraceae bacterium]
MKHAWKELLHGKRKYILIEILLILLMFMVLFLSGLAEGLGRAVIAGIDTMDAKYFLLDDEAEELITVSSLDEEILETVKAQTSSDVAPLDIQRMYLVKDGDTEKLNITYFAVEPGSFIEPAVAEGKRLCEVANEADADGRYPVVLDDDFMLEGISLGDTVYDSSTLLPFYVAGFAKDQMYGHVSIGFISTETYTKLREELSPMYTKKYHALAIQDEDIEKISVEGTELVAKADIISNIPSYTAEHLTITMIVWVLIIVSAVIIGIFHYILTLQKRKQFGVMKALGMSTGELTVTVICQVAILSVFAGA